MSPGAERAGVCTRASPQGRLVHAFGDPQQFCPGDVLAVALGANGDLFVADRGWSRVSALRADATLMHQWGSPGSGPGQLQGPCGLCVSAGGEVLVADTLNHRVQVFSADGSFLREFGSCGSAAGQLNTPCSVAVSVAGEVFVADSANNRVSVFGASDGAFRRIIGAGGGGQMKHPASVAVSAAGELFVGDSNNFRVCVSRCSDGAFLRAFSASVGEGFWRRVLMPEDVAVTAAGEVVVTCREAGPPSCHVFRADGAFVRAFQPMEHCPSGVGVAAGARQVVVAGNSRLHIFE